MSSSSIEGASSIVLELLPNTNTDLSLQDAQRKINAILYQLPTGVKTPSLAKFSTDDIPILKLGVSAKIKPTELYQITKDRIKPQLSKLKGVGQVSLVGGDEREIKINVNRNKLESYKISISKVLNMVGSSNMEFATGKIEGSRNQYTLRLSGKISSLDQLRNLIISKQENNSVIRLMDIAEVVDGTAEYSNLNRINGESSIGYSDTKAIRCKFC